jgi:hypothetical protein
MKIAELIRGETYEFSPIPAAIWPNFTNAVYEGTVSYEVASKLASVAQNHAAALAYLPAGTSRNAQSLAYLLFSVNGTMIPQATEWINEGTLKRTSNGVRTVVINNATAADDTLIRQALSAAGLSVGSIS